MTDQPDLPGASDEWIRELLAEARVTGPVPDDVAARLDETLASLQRERQAPAADRPVVVPLRRRLGPGLAAAAALLAVAGVGLAQLSGQQSGTSTTSADAGVGAATLPSPESRPTTSAPSAKTPLEALTGKAARVPALSRATFAQDAAAFMRDLATAVVDRTGSLDTATTSGDAAVPTESRAPFAAAQAPPVTSAPAPTAAGTTHCPGPAARGAVTYPATFDGTPVALVFRPPSATAQRVEAWSCDGATLLASASVAR